MIVIKVTLSVQKADMRVVVTGWGTRPPDVVRTWDVGGCATPGEVVRRDPTGCAIGRRRPAECAGAELKTRKINTSTRNAAKTNSHELKQHLGVLSIFTLSRHFPVSLVHLNSERLSQI